MERAEARCQRVLDLGRVVEIDGLDVDGAASLSALDDSRIRSRPRARSSRAVSRPMPLEPPTTRAAAIRIIAVLEGAMLMARSLGDNAVFEAAAAGASLSC